MALTLEAGAAMAANSWRTYEPASYRPARDTPKKINGGWLGKRSEISTTLGTRCRLSGGGSCSQPRVDTAQYDSMIYHE